MGVIITFFVFGILGCGASRQEVEEQKEKGRYHYNLAYGHYFDASRPNADAALQEVLKSLRLHPEYPEAHMLAGLIFLGREMHLQAIKHLKRAVDLKPEFYAAKNNLGAAFIAASRWDDAIKVYEGLVGNLMYATPGHGHNNLGWSWYNKGNFDKARRHFTMAIQLAPRLCPAYNNLGMLLLEQKKNKRSRKFLAKAVKMCPGYAEPNYHLGRLADLENDLSEARLRFEKCTKLAGDGPLGERCAQRLTRLPPPSQSVTAPDEVKGIWAP